MKQFDGKKAALHNLGCKVNAYETDAMASLLQNAGFEIVPFSEKADVYVINTCSVTNIADRKSRQMIHRARSMNPSAVVVAAGCYVQTAVDKTGLGIDADIILGTGHKMDLVKELQAYWKEHSSVMQDVGDLRYERRMDSTMLPEVQGRTRAFIKVEDGCDMYCSYCIIPYARGHVRSRKPEEIVEELTHLAGGGTREVILTGIHLSSYGVDFQDSCGGTWQERSRLADLIEKVAEIPGIRRIRLGSLEPTIVTESFADRLAGVKSLCPHFHLSLQSGSNSVLRRMNRHYSAEDYRRCTDILRDRFDDPALTTDVIAGFPGETQEEFEETVRFLSDLRLYETHIFRYSRRAGTRADHMDGQLDEAEKAKRAAVLEELNEKNRAAFISGKNGSKAEVLVEELGDGRIPNAAKAASEGRFSNPEAVACNGRGRTVMYGDMCGSAAEAGAAGSGAKWYTGYTRDYIRTYVSSETDIRGQIVQGRLLVESSVFLV